MILVICNLEEDTANATNTATNSDNQDGESGRTVILQLMKLNSFCKLKYIMNIFYQC